MKKSTKRKTTEQFIDEAQLIHKNKYDYSKVIYTNNKTKVCIICPEHGEFWQTPNDHLNGHSCPKCGVGQRSAKNTKTFSSFIEKARNIYGDKYDYSKVEYKNLKTKVCIICPEHGEFWQTPNDHLNGHSCPKCSNVYQYTTQEFIEKARKVHGDKYDYSKVKYIDSKTKICIICPEHGEFWVTPNSHLQGANCKKCMHQSFKKNKNEFIQDAIQIHGDKYDYSKVEYVDNKTKVCIICPEHGEFYVRPDNFLHGHGCPKCKQSHLEKEIANILEANSIAFIYNKHYDFLEKLQLDFFIPSKKIAIECQGIQHFRINDFFGGKEGYENTLKRDKIKRELCEKNGIKLFYYSDLQINYPYQVFKDTNHLINVIKSLY